MQLFMNVDTLLHQYFPRGGNICIELFDEKIIQQVYRRLVDFLPGKAEVFRITAGMFAGNGKFMSLKGDMRESMAKEDYTSRDDLR